MAGRPVAGAKARGEPGEVTGASDGPAGRCWTGYQRALGLSRRRPGKENEVSDLSASTVVISGSTPSATSGATAGTHRGLVRALADA